MDVSRFVTLTYIGIAATAFVIFNKTLKWIWSSTDVLTEYPIIGSFLTLTTVLAIAAAGGLVFWMYRNKDHYAYISEVIIELKKVTWPPFTETRRSTVIVIIFSVLLSLFLWGSDQVWKQVTDFILSSGA